MRTWEHSGRANFTLVHETDEPDVLVDFTDTYALAGEALLRFGASQSDARVAGCQGSSPYRT